MQKYTSRKAFTLIEIMVVIVIIGIVAVGMSNFNFNRLTEAQKVSIATSEIVNMLEEIRNNALIGKGVGSPISTPHSWGLEISMVPHIFDGGEYNISATYKETDLSPSILYASWTTERPFEILDMKCHDISLSNSDDITGVEFTFTGSNIEASSSLCTGIQGKKVVEFSYGKGLLDASANVLGEAGHQEKIRINTLSGVIERF